LALVEVQQTSDTTFRLYDYGRGRELHLERALAVARCEPYPARHRGSIDAMGPLVESAHFRFDRVAFGEGGPGIDEALRQAYGKGALVLPLEGFVKAREGGAAAGPGECLYAPSLDALDFSAARTALLARSL
jgi:mannose-6-phosphate isomerase